MLSSTAGLILLAQPAELLHSVSLRFFEFSVTGIMPLSENDADAGIGMQDFRKRRTVLPPNDSGSIPFPV